MSNETVLVKRYQNRKLYDTEQSCYVTLSELSEMVKEGRKIQIVDNKTKADITVVTKLQMLAQNEKMNVDNGQSCEDLIDQALKSSAGCFTSLIKDSQSTSKVA